MFSDYNRIKLEVNNRKLFRRSQNIWKLNNTILNRQWVKEEVSKKGKIYFEVNKCNHTAAQNVGDVTKIVIIWMYHIKWL